MKYLLNTIKSQAEAIAFKFFVIICLFIGTATSAQNAADNANGIDYTKPVPNENAGVLSFETEEIDYGTIPQNADGVKVFKFTNTGSNPVVISQVKTSCGCTVPTYSKEPVLAGSTGEIQIKYATNRIGKFTKTITVISNASEPNKVIKIKGEVLKPEE
ncbi:DUF1573 domain-containing protein [Flavobacteriaceae bacterium LMO-SS05]